MSPDSHTDVIVMGGCGRMGATLVHLAQQDDDLALKAVVERADRLTELENLDCLVSADLDEVLAQARRAVVIEFTSADATIEHAAICRRHGNPMVVGTTGLKPGQMETLGEIAKDIPVFHAPNMSVGVNVLLKVLPLLVQMLGPDYDMELMEIHHNRKKDAPSGTALKLAQCMAEARGWNYDDVKRYGRDGIIGERPKKELGVMALRGGDVVGDHTAYFFGPGERIEVTHRAHSRETFAQGALRAAKWLSRKEPGRVYSMADML